LELEPELACLRAAREQQAELAAEPGHRIHAFVAASHRPEHRLEHFRVGAEQAEAQAEAEDLEEAGGAEVKPLPAAADDAGARLCVLAVVFVAVALQVACLFGRWRRFGCSA